VQLHQGLLRERRGLAGPEEELAGPVVVLEEVAVAALVHFLVARLALELAISLDKRTVRRARETDV
jgi:hypothetical protein